MSEEREVFFQFPLCCLCYGDSTTSRVSDIISYCVGDVGLAAWEKLIMEQRTAVASRLTEEESTPRDFDCDAPNHLQFLYGASILNVRLGSMDRTIREYNSVQKHVNSRSIQYGRDAEVRIRNDLAWDTLKEIMPYRDFSVLCGVYSCIGNNKGAVRITRSAITMRAMGYKSAAAIGSKTLEGVAKYRKDGVKPLTERQLRDTLDKLEDRGFFVRVNPSPRKAYFSNRLTHDELAKAVINYEGKCMVAREKKNLANVAARMALSQKRRELKCA